MIIDDFNLDKICSEIKDLQKSDVEHILEWGRLQPHLPIITEMTASLFLHNCDFSCERAKKLIDSYYTIRTHIPELFRNMDPRSDNLMKAQKTLSIGVLPKRTPEKYIIPIARLADQNPENYHFPSSLTLFDMAACIYGHSLGYVPGQILLVDLAGATLQHLAKTNLVLVKKGFKYLQESIPMKLKGIHVVNPVSFMDILFKILKSVAKQELIDLIQIHTKYDSLYKAIPKDCLPVELGGSACTWKDVQDATSRLLLENVEFFKIQENCIVDESKRPGKAKNPDEIFGLEGTFKKLDFD